MDKKVKRPEEEKTKQNKDLPYNPNITSEDKQALNEKGRSMNKNQDKELDRPQDVDFTGKDLDIPGSNSDRPSSPTDIPDEDNRQFNERGERPKSAKKADHPDSDSDIV